MVKKKEAIISVRTDEEMRKKLEAEAKRRGVDLSTLTRNALANFLKPGSVKM